MMPMLFSLGIHTALVRVKEQLREGEYLFAYLDDVYAVVEPDRVRTVYDLLAVALLDVAGIRLNEGKTRTWNRAGLRPPLMEDLGDNVWSPEGVKVLGTPVGSDAFVRQHVEERLADEQRLWDAIPEVPDIQCACSAQALAPTTGYAPCLRRSRGSTLKDTTRGCGRLPRCSWEVCLATQLPRRWLPRWPRCRCGWAGLA